MTPTDIIGVIASSLVLMTFCMRAMLPLRVLGMGSNIAFIVYSL